MDLNPGTGEKPAEGEGRAPARIALLVDDPRELKRIEETLRKASYDVHASSAQDDAVPAIREFAPDCIIVQGSCPDDEVGLISAIRAGQGMDRAPIIALTSEAGQEGGLRSLRAGADLCLAAPCRMP